MQYPKIFHIADLHFFRNKRFDEYKLLIQTLKQSLIDNKIDILYVGGDVIDSKTKLSPEQIRLVTEFFYETSSIVPVIVIPGNHDAMLSNKDTLDSLSPILDNVDPVNPIYYLKETGVYNLYNINWAVWSCLDDKTPVITDDKTYTIGCFHAPINGCTTEAGFSAFHGAVSIDIFEKCQTVMLGDIHLRQSFRNGDIAYPGSWTQVSISEYQRKGGLIWEYDNIQNKYISSFFELDNPYRYETIRIDSFKTFKIQDIKPESKKTLYRFLYTGELENFSLFDLNEVRRKFQEINPENPIILGKQFKKKKDTLSKKEEISSLKVDYFKEFFDKKDIAKELREEVYNIDSEITKKLPSIDSDTGEYLVKKIRIHNFLSYGPDNELDFDQLKGLIGLFGKSTLGKSSIPHAILFCLFNKTPKDSNSLGKLINDQIKDGEKAFVELTLVIKGVEWVIKRAISPGKTVKVTLEVYENVNGVLEQRHDESRPKTDTLVLRPLIGDEATFLSVVFYTHKSQEFVDNKNSQRLELMSRFLGLQLYEQKFAIVEEILKEKEISYKVASKELENLKTDTHLIDSKNTITSTVEGKLKDEKEVIKLVDALHKEKKTFEEQLKTLNLVGSFKTVDEVQEELKGIAVTLEKLKLQNETLLKEKEERVIEWDNLKVGEVEDWEIDQETLQKLYESAQELKTKKNTIKNQIDSSVCKSCNQSIKNIDKDSLKKELESIDLLLNNAEKEITINTLNNKKIAEEKKTLLNVISTLQLNSTKIENALLKEQNIKQELDIINTNDLKIKERTKLNKLLETNNNELLKQTRTHATLQSEIKALQKELEFVEKQIVLYLDKKEKLEVLSKEVLKYSVYKSMMHKTGIPLLILTTFIPFLNTECNEYINDLFDFNIKFEVINDALDISFVYDKQYNSGKGVRDVMQASGMEGTIINLVIRASLFKISTLPKPSFLILDEIFTTLDQESLEQLKELLVKLKMQYQNILIISHLEDIKDLPEHNIKLEKTAGVTKIL